MYDDSIVFFYSGNFLCNRIFRNMSKNNRISLGWNNFDLIWVERLSSGADSTKRVCPSKFRLELPSKVFHVFIEAALRDPYSGRDLPNLNMNTVENWFRLSADLPSLADCSPLSVVRAEAGLIFMISIFLLLCSRHDHSLRGRIRHNQTFFFSIRGFLYGKRLTYFFICLVSLITTEFRSRSRGFTSSRFFFRVKYL